MKRHDVVIAGAGPAGCACAIELARHGCDVLLLSNPADPVRAGEALPPVGNRLLRELGVWEQFRTGPHLPSFGNISAWGSDELRATDFIHHPDGHGWHLDRSAFDSMLRHDSSGRGVHCVRGALQSLCRSHETWSLTAGGVDYEARWVVDCTGRSAAVAHMLGVRRRIHDQLTAFAASFKTGAEDQESVTLIESVESGWWYTSRVPGERRIAVYLTDRRTEARSAAGYRRLLHQTIHVRERMRGFDLETAPRAMAANSSRLERFAGDGWLAAGDAAGAHDPLSSMGICAALLSGQRAAQAVVRALQCDLAGVTAYAEMMRSTYKAYLDAQQQTYSGEHRWRCEPFWSARETVTRPELRVER